MSMAVLQFYNIHRLLGPLAISIGQMLRDLGLVLKKYLRIFFKLIMFNLLEL